MLQAAVVQFPGNNCELETKRALEAAGFKTEIFRWNRKPSQLKKFDLIVLEGGFGYEDRGRSALIISFDPIMATIKKLAHQGKLILGICNGAQALVESGLIPGVKNDDLAMALAKNKRVKNDEVIGTGFYNNWVQIKSVTPAKRSPFNYLIPEKAIIDLPVAHGEGRFTTKNDQVEYSLFANQQVLFQYCNAAGAVIDEYPTNPNGSLANIAAVTNPAGNVMAIMPHPERGLKAPGEKIFASIHAYLSDKKRPKKRPTETELDIKIKPPKVEKYKQKRGNTDIFIELLITDNEEFTLHQTLEKLDIAPVNLKKFRFVTIDSQKKLPPATIVKLIKSNLVANVQKEVCHINQGKDWYTIGKSYKPKERDSGLFTDPALRTRYRDDTMGLSWLEPLKKLCPQNTIRSVETGLVWEFQSSEKLTQKALKELSTHRLFWNPHSQTAQLIISN